MLSCSAPAPGAPRIDHAVINVRFDMDAAAARFRALGFTLTGRGHHSLGSINHLMVFDRDYLELVGLPLGGDRIRREIAESAAGLDGLVFATDDAARLHDRLVARGVPVEPLVAFDRPVTIDGIEHRASFRTVRLARGHLQGGRVYFCEHETPDLVWRAPWQAHRNAVHALAAITIVVDDPARAASAYTNVAGGVLRHLTADESSLAFGACTVRFLAFAAYRSRYGSFAASAGGRAAFMGVLALRSSSLARVCACLDEASEATQAQCSPTRVTLAAACAWNTVLEFVL